MGGRIPFHHNFSYAFRVFHFGAKLTGRTLLHYHNFEAINKFILQTTYCFLLKHGRHAEILSLASAAHILHKTIDKSLSIARPFLIPERHACTFVLIFKIIKN